MTTTAGACWRLVGVWLAMLCVGAIGAYADGTAPAANAPQPASHEVNLTFCCNPQDGFYGGGSGWGAWMKDSPLYGDYFLSVFHNGLEHSMYAGCGATVRLMPHWFVAPFVGAGGSFNTALGKKNDLIAGLRDYYCGGHVESGLRVALPQTRYSCLVSGRYTWSTAGRDQDYWLIGLTVSGPF